MIKIHGKKLESFKFPVGEISVDIGQIGRTHVNIEFVFDGSDSILELLLVSSAIRSQGGILNFLIMPYVPFSRQDRIMKLGEAFSLRMFCELINNLKFNFVEVEDAHSYVTTALLNNCIEIKQHEIFSPMLENFKDYYLISPDGGALKKIYELAKRVNSLGVIECSKERDIKTGEIKRTIVHHHKSLDGKDCVIVDDICDGGRTFIEIAKVLKNKECGKIILCVTHGLFTKGINVFDGLIDEIHTNKGRVK